MLRLDTDRGRFTLTTKKLEQKPGDMLRDPQLVYQVAEKMAAAWRASKGITEATAAGGKDDDGQQAAEAGEDEEVRGPSRDRCLPHRYHL